MSEQNIWNNTYVLGDVSATQIVAGEGIKIDTTEPGVIKVSNDETVLWEGTGSNPNYVSGTFTENPWNFSSLKFYQCNLQGGKCVNEVELYDNPTSADMSIVIMAPRGNNEINYDAVKLLVNPSTWSATNSKTLAMSWTTTAFANNNNVANALKSVIKIIGVNRISGGN